MPVRDRLGRVEPSRSTMAEHRSQDGHRVTAAKGMPAAMDVA